MADNRTADIVADLDHVTTVLPDRPARQLFSGLGRLGLFVAWPYADYGPLWTGGIRLGNLNLEVIGVAGEAGAGQAGTGDAGPAEARAAGPGAGGAAAGQAEPGDAEPGEAEPGEAEPGEAGSGEPATGGHGAGEPASGRPGTGPDAAGADGAGQWPRQVLTLAPASLAGLPEELDQRGVRHGDLVPFPPQPQGESICTTMDLPDLGGDALAVQFCAYPEGPRTRTVPPGDLAGVQQVERVVVGASDIGAARDRWAALLAPEGGSARAEEGPVTVWQPGYGPALELRPAAADAVLELVLQVRSLALARAAFTAAGLNVSGNVVTIGTLPARLVSG